MLPIVRMTLREGMRRKLLHLFLGLTGISTLFLLNLGHIEFDDRRVTAADMLAYVGQWMSLIFTSLLTIFVSMNAIGAEVDRQSIHLALVRPVTRIRFWLERWIGVCLLNWISMAILLGVLAVSLMLKCGPEALHYVLPSWLVFPFAVACVSALVVALNSRIPASAAGLIGVVLVLLGFYHSQLSVLSWERAGPVDELARLVLLAIPPLSDVVPQVGKLARTQTLELWLVVRWLTYTWVCIGLGMLAFQRREV